MAFYLNEFLQFLDVKNTDDWKLYALFLVFRENNTYLNLHKGQIPSKSLIFVGPKPRVVYIVLVQLRLVEKPMKFCQNSEDIIRRFPSKNNKTNITACRNGLVHWLKFFRWDGSSSKYSGPIIIIIIMKVWSFLFFRTSHIANSSSEFSSSAIFSTIGLPSASISTFSDYFPSSFEGVLIVSDTFTRCWQPNFEDRDEQTNVLLKRK